MQRAVRSQVFMLLVLTVYAYQKGSSSVLAS